MTNAQMNKFLSDREVPQQHYDFIAIDPDGMVCSYETAPVFKLRLHFGLVWGTSAFGFALLGKVEQPEYPHLELYTYE